jgi:hypothetical protein
MRSIVSTVAQGREDHRARGLGFIPTMAGVRLTGMVASATPLVDHSLALPPRRPRWVVPLSLRMYVAILVLLGVGSTLFTWVAYRREQKVYLRERLAILEIESWGGSASPVAGGSVWLRKLARQGGLIDIRFFQRISFIYVDGRPESRGRRGERHPAVTDADLARLQLSRLTNLDGVSFDDTAVTDTGLAQLSGLTSLREVSVNDTAVSDAGLAHLAGLTNLEYALLAGTAVTDAGLVHLSKLKSLRYVFLSRTAVTDAGLAYLSGLTSLQELFLDGTAVTDGGLVHLHGLTRLNMLRLANTKVTDAGVAELQRALPYLSIDK